MAKNPYDILGVKKDATDADIKTAYRKLAKKHHPDLNPGQKDAEEKFKEIGNAHNLLSDKDKRAAFDRGEIDMEGQPVRPQQQYYRDHAQGAGGQRYYSGSAGAGADFDPSDFEDLFGSFFKGGGRGRAGGFGGGAGGFGRDPEPAHYSTEIDFLEAALGGKTRVTLPDGGTLDITLPEGIDEGQKLRLKGKGNKGADGQAADAFIEVHIRPHPQFTRKGRDIYAELPIGFHESILGSKVEVPTIHGKVDMTIPKGASSGSALRLKGKGIKGGDQFVKLKIVMPTAIDSELEAAVRTWAEKHSYNPRQAKESV